MASKRYELNEAQWARIAALLPGTAADPGRSGLDNRLFVNGCLWVLRSGAHWCDLPERYGKWKSVHRRFSRWCHAGVWERVFDALTADRDNQYLMIDSTIVRAHQQAATGKGGRAIRRWGVPEAACPPRSICSRMRSAGPGTVSNFVCGVAVEHQAAMARMKRSPKITANCALAIVHSRGGIVHSFSDRFKIRKSNLAAASSLGKWPRARTARRSLELRASMAFVV